MCTSYVHDYITCMQYVLNKHSGCNIFPLFSILSTTIFVARLNAHAQSHSAFRLLALISAIANVNDLKHQLWSDARCLDLLSLSLWHWRWCCWSHGGENLQVWLPASVVALQIMWIVCYDRLPEFTVARNVPIKYQTVLYLFCFFFLTSVIILMYRSGNVLGELAEVCHSEMKPQKYEWRTLKA